MNAIGLAATLVIAFLGGAWAFTRLRPDFARAHPGRDAW